jgi:hypothetical protein
MRKSIPFIGLATAGTFAIGLAVGQILGIGATSAASQPAARSHPSFAGPPPGRPTLGPRADGTVTAISGNTITIKGDGNHGPSPSTEYDTVTTVVVDSATKIHSGPGQSGTLSSIKVGSFVIAEGTLSSDKTTLTATSIMIGHLGSPGGSPGAWGPPPGAPGAWH